MPVAPHLPGRAAMQAKERGPVKVQSSLFVLLVMAAGVVACEGLDEEASRSGRRSRGSSEGTTEEGSPASAQGIFADTSRLWPDPSNIPVCWEPGAEARTQEKSWVQEALAASWSTANPRIQFRGWGTCGAKDAGIRIRANSTSAAGPWSLLGVQPGGKPTKMELALDIDAQAAVDASWRTFLAPCLASEAARRTCVEAIAVHEFGHALGIHHEQDRSEVRSPCDREQSYVPNAGMVFGPYDAASIMNYCTENRIMMGTRLSAGDEDGIRRLYAPGGPEGAPNPGRIALLDPAAISGRPGSMTLTYRGTTDASGLPDPATALVIVDGSSRTVVPASPWRVMSSSVFTRATWTPAPGGFREATVEWNGAFVSKIEIAPARLDLSIDDYEVPVGVLLNASATLRFGPGVTVPDPSFEAHYADTNVPVAVTAMCSLRSDSKECTVRSQGPLPTPGEVELTATVTVDGRTVSDVSSVDVLP